MSGARPSAGRRVLAFPCVSAPGVGAACRLGELRCPGPPPRPPSLPRAPRRGAPRLEGSQGARGGSRGQPGTAATPAREGRRRRAGARGRRGRDGDWGAGGRGRARSAVGRRRGRHLPTAEPPGWRRAQSSRGACRWEGPPHPSPLRPARRNFIPTHPARLELLQ